jgi:hypothetical protein
MQELLSDIMVRSTWLRADAAVTGKLQIPEVYTTHSTLVAEGRNWTVLQMRSEASPHQFPSFHPK